jgi:hypothetical protein
MKLNDLPQEIEELAIKRSDFATKEIQEDDSIGGLFRWKETPEGLEFWREINQGNFEPFYAKYGRKTGKPVEYKLNYYNPLFYIATLVGFILVILASPFEDESLSRSIKKNVQDLKGPRINNPRKIALYLGIVIRKR